MLWNCGKVAIIVIGLWLIVTKTKDSRAGKAMKGELIRILHCVVP